MITKNIYRTHSCGELRIEDAGKEVKLAGWVNSIRELGGLTFVTLRDQFGITQLVVKDDKMLTNVNKECTITISGKVVERESKNPKMPTGDIEIVVEQLKVLGKSQSALPFEIANALSTREDLRLKYRYLDLRNQETHDLIELRSKMLHFTRNKMYEMGFTEVQTPILANSSPEGARDFLVPTVTAPGEFFALPQAPQQFKQLLMVSGFDRYFQVAPCFRNEPARADRTPGEFYQIDMEMSFATQDDVLSVGEEFATNLFKNLCPERKCSTAPFVRIPYLEAMEKYCSDKPDLRNPLIVHDLTKEFTNTEFNAFKNKRVKAIAAVAGEQSRKWYDEIGQVIVAYEGKGCAWVKFNDGEFTGSIVKFLTEDNKQNLITEFNLKGGESLFFVADSDEMAPKLANVLRNELGKRLNLINENEIAIAWIVDFPFFEKNKETGALDFSHNPFTMPKATLDEIDTKDPYTIFANQFDLVINGHECLSGAVRNHDQEMMVKLFEKVGYNEEVVKKKFGALYTAFSYGAPPHAGCAFGFDTMLMIVANKEYMRDIIAFPLNNNARDLLMNSPCKVDDQLLKDVGLQLIKKEDKGE
ncbi:MAG: aspartate--tRNA ligase [Clostridia bacterium]|nr:aspartate--tRNA ligase [Clostridia bacterium]